MLTTEHKAYIRRWTGTAAAAALIVFAAFLLIGLVVHRDNSMAHLKPMIAEAKELNLSFEQAAKEPERLLGKHVIWCVQNRAKDGVYSQGEGRFTVENYGEMPLVFGSKHSSCEKMLLQLKGGTRTPSGSAIPAVRFVSSL